MQSWASGRNKALTQPSASSDGVRSKEHAGEELGSGSTEPEHRADERVSDVYNRAEFIYM